MLIDLISTNNNVCFNSKIAQLVGLEAAIYASEVMRIYNKAAQKKVLIDGYCTLNRGYIQERTTLNADAQKKAEEILSNLNILEKNSNGSVYLNVNTILELVSTTDEMVLKAVETKVKKVTNRKTKREIIFDQLKGCLVCENSELRSAYCDWIDSVCANPKGFLSKKSLEIFQRKIETFANHDLDVALSLLEIATVGGFRDADWAIENYRKKYGVSYRLPESIEDKQTSGQLSEDLF